MKICFASHDGVVFYKGGPYTKIKETIHHFQAKGIKADLFNMWDTKLNEYDLIHLVSSNFAVYNLARNMKNNNIKYIVEPVFFSTHSENFLKFFNNADRLFRKISRGIWFDYGFTRDICEWSEKITPNTNDEFKLISSGLSITQKKFKIIHNGVSENFLNSDPSLFEKKFGLKNFILCVGHIGPSRKNMFRLMKALTKINHQAVFIGKIFPLGETEYALNEAKKNKNIKFIDPIENDSEILASAYTACDTFVLPSLYETPGIAALEAGLAGAKITITPFGGTKDYFNDMAEYVNPYSVDSIKEGIEKNLNKKKNNKLQEHIKQNFLWDKIADETINLYRQILKR